MKIFKQILAHALLISIFLGLTGCKMVDSYKLFCFEGISYISNNEELHAPEYEFAKLDNVLLVPEIKEVRHSEYTIYLSAYSQTGTEQITITDIMLQESEKDVFSRKLCKKIQFEMNEDGLYEGWIDGGTLTEADLEIDGGKAYDFIVNVELQKNDSTVLKSFVFPVVIKEYKSFAMPT